MLSGAIWAGLLRIVTEADTGEQIDKMACLIAPRLHTSRINSYLSSLPNHQLSALNYRVASSSRVRKIW